METKISHTDAIRDKKLTRTCFFNQFKMRDVVFLALVQGQDPEVT